MPFSPLLSLLVASTRVTEQTEARLINKPENWAVFLIVCAIVLVVALIYRKELQEGIGRFFLGALRVAAIGLILFVVVFQLAAVTERVEVQDGTVICLVDASLSMSIQDRFRDPARQRALADLAGVSPDEVARLSRAEIVRRALARRSVAIAGVDQDLRVLDRLTESNHVVIYTFAGPQPVPLLALPKEGTEGPGDGEASEDGAAGPPSPTGRGDGGEGEGAEPPPTFGAGGLPSVGEAPEGVDLAWYRGEIEGRNPALGAIARIDPQGSVTAIADALNAALLEQRNRRIAAVVLITDGRQTAPGILPMERVARRLASKDIPLFAVAVGNPEEPRDIAVADAHGPEVVIAGDQANFDALVTARGFEGEQVRVELLIDGQLAGQEILAFRTPDESLPVRLRWLAETPREEPYPVEIRIEEQTGEITAENNERILPPVRVVDNKIRVLYIEGMPRWEYRYLKNCLIRDDTMEVQCWLMSASPSFPQESSPNLQPLFAIPASRDAVVLSNGATIPGIFDFDVIIIGDVRPDDLGVERMEIIKEFVESSGGGLLMISGTDYAPNEYRGTPLADILPVIVEEQTSLPRLSPGPITEPFNVHLTDEGREHPVMRLVDDPQANQQLWETSSAAPGQGLPGFYWYRQVRRARPGARVLAEHPFREAPGSGSQHARYPIVATMYAGAGQTFWMGVDSTWRWRAGVGDRYFARFWGQAVRYLATGKLLKTRRFTLQTDRPEYNVSEQVRVTATVLDRDNKPSTAPTWTIHHEMPPRHPGDAPRREEIELQAVPSRPGAYQGTIQALEIGTHRIWIGPEDPGENRSGADDDLERTFLVVVPRLEFQNPRADEESLRALVQAVGAGEVLPIERIGDLPTKIGPILEQIPSPKAEDPMWDEWWVLLAAACLLTVEWIGRKVLRLA